MADLVTGIQISGYFRLNISVVCWHKPNLNLYDTEIPVFGRLTRIQWTLLRQKQTYHIQQIGQQTTFEHMGQQVCSEKNDSLALEHNYFPRCLLQLPEDHKRVFHCRTVSYSFRPADDRKVSPKITFKCALCHMGIGDCHSPIRKKKRISRLGKYLLLSKDIITNRFFQSNSLSLFLYIKRPWIS